MSDVVLLKLYVETWFAGCQDEDIYDYEVDREEWESMSMEEQKDFMSGAVLEFITNYVIDCSAWVIEDEHKYD